MLSAIFRIYCPLTLYSAVCTSIWPLSNFNVLSPFGLTSTLVPSVKLMSSAPSAEIFFTEPSANDIWREIGIQESLIRGKSRKPFAVISETTLNGKLS